MARYTGPVTRKSRPRGPAHGGGAPSWQPPPNPPPPHLPPPYPHVTLIQRNTFPNNPRPSHDVIN